MSDKKPDTKRVDERSVEEIGKAQKGLLKILAVATIIPVIWVVLLAGNGYTNFDQASAKEAGFVTFVITWGLLSPVVWAGCYGYTYWQVGKGNMNAGQYLPLVPALWIIFWFAAQLTR